MDRLDRFVEETVIPKHTRGPTQEDEEARGQERVYRIKVEEGHRRTSALYERMRTWTRAITSTPTIDA
jgi:hypothetical protein